MFGSSTPFGKPSGNPFGMPSDFGPCSNQGNNPFALKPFGGGASSPFGSQTGSSVFGGTSTGVFGATQISSPFSSTTDFGTSSSPAFGSLTSAFGASSTPSVFVGSSVFGSEKPGFGAFGSTPSQPSPLGSTPQPPQPAFGSTSQPSQPAFGNSLFGSFTAFGASSQLAFGASSTPAFGTMPTTSLFGTGGASGASTSPAFGAPSATPTFGVLTASAVGVSNTPAFGVSSSPAFSFGSSTALGTSPSPFRPWSTTPTFGKRGGSRVAAFAVTTITDSSDGSAEKFRSISAMPAYKDKSHEELRWEDYQSGDKGGPSGLKFGPSPNCRPASGIFSNTSTSNTLAPTTLFISSGVAPSVSSSPSIFSPSPTTPSPFPTTLNTPPSTAGFVPSSFSTQAQFISSGVAPSVSSSPSIFSPSPTTPSPFPTTLNTSPSTAGFVPSSFSTQARGSAPTLSTSLFKFPGPVTQTNNASGLTTNIFGPNITSYITQSTPSLDPSAGFTSALSSTQSLTSSTNNLLSGQTTSLYPAPLPAAQPAKPSYGLNSQQQQASGDGGATAGMFGNLQNSGPVQAVPASNPFGTLPAMPRVSVGCGGTSPALQYGISSMPAVPDKAAPLRISSVLTSRHLSQRRLRLPARKYHPNTDVTKVPFFSDGGEIPKANALFFPRENPRALVMQPSEQWPSKASADKPSTFKDASPLHRNGNGVGEEIEANEDMPMTRNGYRDGEAATLYEQGAGIDALMPKLRRSDYYTEPRIQDLAAKERADPGFCGRVTDFVVGRHGFGHIKFLGETDVRGVDVESVVEFNKREVIVYRDDTKTPPVGQGLNKPAEVTLLNIKCAKGPAVERYTEMLKRKTEDQGAEFVSYDPVKGQWKFRVTHFS